MTTLTLTLPIPPGTNNLYATVHGHRVLSSEGRAYKARASRLAIAEALVSRWRYPVGGRLTVAVRLWFADRRRRDIDNIKALIDSIAEGLRFDDCMIDRLEIERAGVDKERPRAEVTLTVLPDARETAPETL